MTNNLLNELKIMIQDNTWMDAQSKAKAIEKANYIRPQIAYPDYYDNVTFVQTTFTVRALFIYPIKYELLNYYQTTKVSIRFRQFIKELLNY